MTADPFTGIPNADDSLNGEFSPAARPRQPSIIEPVDQAGYYLRQANDAGLPLPSYVTVSAHHGGSHIGIQLASDEQVRQWARRFGAKTVLTRRGISAAIGDANRHEVSTYHMFPKPAEVPGPPPPVAADPGDTAPAGTAPKHPRDMTREWTKHFGDSRGWYSRNQGIAGLAEHTQAACDTITKASQ